MMLISTLNKELDFIDWEIRALTESKFAMLARSDASGAARLQVTIRSLQARRDELAGTKPFFHEKNE